MGTTVQLAAVTQRRGQAVGQRGHCMWTGKPMTEAGNGESGVTPTLPFTEAQRGQRWAKPGTGLGFGSLAGASERAACQGRWAAGANCTVPLTAQPSRTDRLAAHQGSATRGRGTRRPHWNAAASSWPCDTRQAGGSVLPHPQGWHEDPVAASPTLPAHRTPG